MITVQQSWAGDTEWFVRCRGRYCGEVIYFPHSGQYRSHPIDRIHPVRTFDDIDAAVTYVALNN